MKKDNISESITYQPGETVYFKGKKATIESVFPNGDFVILQNGMTIDCTKSQLSTYEKIDVEEDPMEPIKFTKEGVPVDEAYVRCKVSINGISLMNEATYVNYGEWKRKKPKMNVRIIKEDYDEFTVPKENVGLLELPEPVHDTLVTHTEGQPVDGFVHGVILGADGDAVRKILINSSSYTNAQDDDYVEIMYISEEGYKEGKLKKNEISTLSV